MVGVQRCATAHTNPGKLHRRPNPVTPRTASTAPKCARLRRLMKTATSNVRCAQRESWWSATSPRGFAPARHARRQPHVCAVPPTFLVARLESEVVPTGPGNPYGLSLRQKNSPLRTQAEGKQDFNWATQCAWKVVNDDVHKGLGTPPAYKRGRASPVPAATIRTFRAPYAGKSITAALPGSSPLPWPSPFSSGLDTPSPHPSPGR